MVEVDAFHSPASSISRLGVVKTVLLVNDAFA